MSIKLLLGIQKSLFESGVYMVEGAVFSVGKTGLFHNTLSFGVCVGVDVPISQRVQGYGQVTWEVVDHGGWSTAHWKHVLGRAALPGEGDKSQGTPSFPGCQALLPPQI